MALPVEAFPVPAPASSWSTVLCGYHSRLSSHVPSLGLWLVTPSRTTPTRRSSQACATVACGAALFGLSGITQLELALQDLEEHRHSCDL